MSGNHQGKVNCVSQVDGDSAMAPALWLCVGRAQKRNNGLCQHFCLGENCSFSSGTNARQLTSSLYVPDAPVLELRTNESSESVYMGPLKGTPGVLPVAAQWAEHQPEKKGWLVRIPVRAHALVVSQVPSGEHARGNHTLMFLSFSFSLPSPPSKNK